MKLRGHHVRSSQSPFAPRKPRYFRGAKGDSPRRGFTLLEFVVALLLFGFAMSGLFPLVVMYSRALESLEQRPSQLSTHRNASVDGNAYRLANPAEWYQVGTAPYTRTASQPNAGDWVHKWYFVPSSDTASQGSDVWARKLAQVLR